MSEKPLAKLLGTEVFFSGFIIFSILFISCSKKTDVCNYNDSNVTASATEIANIQTYLTSNGITATQHQSGFFYRITQMGTGQAIVNLCSNVSVKYAGKLTNGTYFDPTTPGTTSFFDLPRQQSPADNHATCSWR